MRRAYDTVWHGQLLRKIKEVGLSGQMYNFVKAFLSKKTFQVRFFRNKLYRVWHTLRNTSRLVLLSTWEGGGVHGRSIYILD